MDSIIRNSCRSCTLAVLLSLSASLVHANSETITVREWPHTFQFAGFNTAVENGYYYNAEHSGLHRDKPESNFIKITGLGNEEAPPPSGHWLLTNWPWMLAAFVALFIVLSLILIVHLNRQYRRRTTELQLSESRYRTLVEYANVIYWKFDVKLDRFTYVSPQIKSILGYDPGDWTNLESWANQIHPDDRDSAVNYCFIETAAGKNHNFEYRCIAADGSIVWIRDTVSVKMGYGGAEELIGFMADITSIKQEAIKNQRTQEKIAQNRKLQALGQLTGGIAHDFNNILAIILGHCELIDSTGNPKLARQIAIIQSATERGRDLVGNMLTYSRDQHDSPHLIDPGPAINEQLNLLRATIPSSIEIKVSIAEELPMIKADKLYIQQIIINLAINARDAMNGKGILTVSASQSEWDGHECSACMTPITGQWVDICVSDNGTGIQSNNTSKLFEPFFSTKETGKGSGMGLAVVSGILKQSGGHILVLPSSQFQTGTEFHVLFPVAPITRERKPDAPAKPREIYSGNGERILVLDDEAQLASVLGELLNTAGFNATTESDSIKILEAIDNLESRFDLIITDQSMPGISGLDLVAQLRNRKIKIPVILCTGYSDAIDKEIARDLDINYLQKPVDSQKLFAMVANVLRRYTNQPSTKQSAIPNYPESAGNCPVSQPTNPSPSR